jgi:hypothetical protein
MDFVILELTFVIPELTKAKNEGSSTSMSSSFSQNISATKIPGLLRLFRTTRLSYGDAEKYMRETHLLLDISWTELRETICALRPIVGRDPELLAELVDWLLGTSLPGEAYPWPSLCRELASRCIRLIRDVNTGHLPKAMRESVPAMKAENFAHNSTVFTMPSTWLFSLERPHHALNFFAIYGASCHGKFHDSQQSFRLLNILSTMCPSGLR